MAERYYALNDALRFGVTTHNPSGGALINADETPRWTIFEDATDTPILTGSFTQRTGYDGTYRGTATASAANGFESSKFYEIHASGAVNGTVGRAIIDSFILDDIYDANVEQVGGVAVTSINAFHSPPSGTANAVWEESRTGHTTVDTFGESLQDIYYADIKFVKDVTNSQDEYSLCWFKNSATVSSGDITSPAISVYRTDNGVALFESQTLNYASTSLGVLRHDSVITTASGEPYLVVTSGTIDAATRSWKKVVGVDWL